jgi:hypothetical protein
VLGTTSTKPGQQGIRTRTSTSTLNAQNPVPDDLDAFATQVIEHS